uniref:Nucelotide kinase n=1 Tax=Siphoviridae sp. ctoNj20 TaxID=2826085 RepID=A0A8D9PDY1_9CAUD|nr:MAG TPA: nucelotide kinase [Siphoviridae sp. ctoNj20]
MADVINHPPHYTLGKIEVIDFIEDKGLNFNLGNVVKYVARAGHKKSSGKSMDAKALEDLKKAQWYLNREISSREAK